MKFRIIGQSVTDPAWNGSGQTLNYHDSVMMPQTPNGSMVLGYWNISPQNNDGTLALTSGGPPRFLDAPAGALIPSILVQNWNANSLTLTNVSANKVTPLRVEAFGPGIPGVVPLPLPLNVPTQLSTLQVAQGKAPPNYAQIVLANNNNNLSIIALIGGPLDSNNTNAYVFALNYQGPPNPPGFTSVTPGNSMTYQFYWNTSVFVANLSPAMSSSVAVSLIPL